jgi:hypothetical protein
MERGGGKQSAKIDDELKSEVEPLERSTKESHVEEFLEKEAPGVGEPGAEVTGERPGDGEPGSGHRIAGTGSSAESYSYKDRGEEGGASHPRPKDPEERTDRG